MRYSFRHSGQPREKLSTIPVKFSDVKRPYLGVSVEETKFEAGDGPRKYGNGKDGAAATIRTEAGRCDYRCELTFR